MPEKFSNPKLYTANGRLDASWFVYFHAVDPATGKKKRYRVAETLNQYKTASERMAAGKKLVAKYKKKLQRGWNPFGTAIADGSGHGSAPGGSLAPTVPSASHLIKPTLLFLMEVEKTRWRPKTHQTNQSKTRRFFRWLRENGLDRMDIRDFTEAQAFGFWDSLADIKAKTRNRYTQILKQSFKMLAQRGVLDTNPFRDIPHLPVTTQPFPAFKDYQVKRLITYMDAHDQQLAFAVRLLYSCFIRPGELRQLKVGDFNFDEWQIRLRSEISKNKKTEMVAVPDAIRQWVKAHRLDECPETFYVFGKDGVPGEKPLAQNELATRHRKMLKAVGISDEYKLYSWKHTGVVAAVKAGISMKELQNQLRHHSLDQVDQYLQSLGIKDMDNFRRKFPGIGE